MSLFSKVDGNIITPSKSQMLERLQFSKNYQIALRCCQLLSGELHEKDLQGMFLDAVCRNDFKDAMMRADDHNKSALLAKDFAVVNMVYSISDTTGYMINERYYLKLRFNCGFIEVHPPASVTADIKLYRTINKFLKEWSI